MCAADQYSASTTLATRLSASLNVHRLSRAALEAALEEAKMKYVLSGENFFVQRCSVPSILDARRYLEYSHD